MTTVKIRKSSLMDTAERTCPVDGCSQLWYRDRLSNFYRHLRANHKMDQDKINEVKKEIGVKSRRNERTIDEEKSGKENEAEVKRVTNFQDKINETMSDSVVSTSGISSHMSPNKQISGKAGRERIECPVCRYICKRENISNMWRHCSIRHGWSNDEVAELKTKLGMRTKTASVAKICTVRRTFETVEEFQIWNEEECKATCTSWIQEQCYFTKKGEVTRFSCNRQRKRNGKSSSNSVSRKLPTNCTAHCKVVVSEEAIEVEANFEHNHPLEPEFLRLTEGEKLILQGLLSDQTLNNVDIALKLEQFDENTSRLPHLTVNNINDLRRTWTLDNNETRSSCELENTDPVDYSNIPPDVENDSSMKNSYAIDNQQSSDDDFCPSQWDVEELNSDVIDRNSIDKFQKMVISFTEDLYENRHDPLAVQTFLNLKNGLLAVLARWNDYKASGNANIIELSEIQRKEIADELISMKSKRQKDDED